MSEIQLTRLGAIATVTLSHPKRRNAITTAMWMHLERLMREIDADDSVRCVIVRGAGGNFSAGADLSEFAEVRANLAQAQHYHEELIAPALQALRDCRHPVVAQIEGWCTGGGFQIAAACDIRIGADSASFGIPIGRLGFNLAPHEIKLLVSVVGHAIARELLLEGRILTAHEAFNIEFLHRIVDAAEIGAQVASTTRQIANAAPGVTRMHKRLLNELADTGTLSEASSRDAYHWADSDDYKEGITAFLQKRMPDFKGK